MANNPANEVGGLSPRPVCLFAHGWAYSLDFFTPLLFTLADDYPDLMPQFRTLGMEQGYFERPAGVYEWTGKHWSKVTEMDIKTCSIAIGIGHSLGFSKLLELRLQTAYWVSLHGFTRFTSHEHGQPGTPKRLIERMLSKLSSHPARVLQDFWARAEDRKLPLEPFKASAVNLERLASDLQSMLGMDLTRALCEIPENQLLAIWSGEDQIVAPELSAQSFHAERMLEAMAPHSGPQVIPKVYTAQLVKVLNQTLDLRLL